MKCSVDFHGHLYPWFDLSLMLNSIIKNSQKNFGDDADVCALFLTEREGQQWFEQTRKKGAHRLIDEWFCEPCDDGLSLKLSNESHCVYFICSRQIVSHENIEVLALGTDLPLSDGQKTEDIIHRIIESGGVPVLPWGLGKWLGKRGCRIDSLCQLFKNQTLFIGDTSMRPTVYSGGKVFVSNLKNGMLCLPGSDSLVLKGEEKIAGKFAALIEIKGDSPGQEIIDFLKTCKSLEYPKVKVSVFSVISRFFRLKLHKSEEGIATAE